MGSADRLLRARDAALKLLQHALGGDALGAEALLLSLLSQSTARCVLPWCTCAMRGGWCEAAAAGC